MSSLDRRLGFIVPGATAPLVDSFFASSTQIQQLLFAESEEFCCCWSILANRYDKMHLAHGIQVLGGLAPPTRLRICVGKPLYKVGLRPMACSYVAHVQSLAVKIVSWASSDLISDLTYLRHKKTHRGFQRNKEETEHMVNASF